MKKSFGDAPYERYADDAVIHVKTKKRADQILGVLTQRMMDVQLELLAEKRIAAQSLTNRYLPIPRRY